MIRLPHLTIHSWLKTYFFTSSKFTKLTIRMRIIIIYVLLLSILGFAGAAPSSQITDLQMTREKHVGFKLPVIRRDDNDTVIDVRDLSHPSVQENLFGFDDSTYAKLCDKDGKDCSGSYSLKNSSCWYRDGKISLKIYSSSTPNDYFILYTVSPSETCPGDPIASQYIGKVHNTQLININSNGTKFYFDKIYFGEWKKSFRQINQHENVITSGHFKRILSPVIISSYSTVHFTSFFFYRTEKTIESPLHDHIDYLLMIFLTLCFQSWYQILKSSCVTHRWNYFLFWCGWF